MIRFPSLDAEVLRERVADFIERSELDPQEEQE